LPDLFPTTQPPEIQQSATFGRDRLLRWTITCVWGPGPRLCFVGHNPAKADETVRDVAVRRWIAYGQRWGFGQYTAVNLYPIRTADPTECRRWIGDAGKWRFLAEDMAENMDVIRREAAAADMVVACWGAIAHDPAHVMRVVEAIGRDIYCFGKTTSGAPMRRR